MKILYITMSGKRIDRYDNTKEYDFEHISNIIVKGIKNKFKDIEITFPNQIAAKEDSSLHPHELMSFDLFLCDMTTLNPNVAFVSGVAEGMNKPVIYFISSESMFLAAASYNPHLLYSDATIDNEFIKQLNNLIEAAINDPANFKQSISAKTTKPKAFISYSHNDKEYLDRLLVHLKPLERKGLIDVWQDTKIKTGHKWEEEISKALAESNIAILLVSADFMASDFIVNNELPPLLSKAEVKGTKILPVILSHCRFLREPSLNGFQAANSPNDPLSNLSYNEREAIYDKVAKEIEDALFAA